MRRLSGNVTTDMDLAVGDLADAARHSPAVVEHLQSYDVRTALATLDDISDDPVFRTAWDPFIVPYVMRGPAEIDIARRRWRDDPTSLMQFETGQRFRVSGDEGFVEMLSSNESGSG